MKKLLKIFKKLRPQPSPLQQARKILAHHTTKGTPLRIELGAGGRKLDGWVSYDMLPSSDIQGDINKWGIPFPDESVDEIYSSHVLEHFLFPTEMMPVLTECLRVLKTGGTMKIAVPDSTLYINGYLAKEFPYHIIEPYPPAFHYRTPIDSINYMAYMAGDHRHMFDLENLLAILTFAGFNHVQKRNFEAGLDIERRAPQSIYASAKK